MAKLHSRWHRKMRQKYCAHDPLSPWLLPSLCSCPVSLFAHAPLSLLMLLCSAKASNYLVISACHLVLQYPPPSPWYDMLHHRCECHYNDPLSLFVGTASGGVGAERGVCVYPWHALVPYLTNTQPNTAATAPDTSSTSQQTPPEGATASLGTRGEETCAFVMKFVSFIKNLALDYRVLYMSVCTLIPWVPPLDLPGQNDMLIVLFGAGGGIEPCSFC